MFSGGSSMHHVDVEGIYRRAVQNGRKSPYD